MKNFAKIIVGGLRRFMYGTMAVFATVAASAKMADYYQAATKVNDRVIFDGGNDVADLRQWTEEGDSQLLGFAWTD